MATEQQRLYQQLVLDHNRHPKNYGILEKCTHKAEGFNPVCGDHVWLYLNVNEQHLQDLSFEGEGCAICKASTSMMTEAIKGKSVDSTMKLFGDFSQMLSQKDHAPELIERLGSLAMFNNLWQYPARIKCASLAWHTLKAALNSQEKVCSE